MASVKEQLQELQKTTVGKVIIVAVPLVIIAIIFLVVFMVVLNNNPETGSSTAANQLPAASSSSSPTAEQNAGETTPPANEEKEPTYSENLDVFQPRDPFQSPIEEETATTTAPASSTTETASSTSTSTANTSSQTATKLLLLESTYNKDGQMYARMKYGEDSYEVKAGDQIDTSSYKVLKVENSSVILLYGDDQLTLAVGQEVYK